MSERKKLKILKSQLEDLYFDLRKEVDRIEVMELNDDPENNFFKGEVRAYNHCIHLLDELIYKKKESKPMPYFSIEECPF